MPGRVAGRAPPGRPAFGRPALGTIRPRLRLRRPPTRPSNAAGTRRRPPTPPGRPGPPTPPGLPGPPTPPGLPMPPDAADAAGTPPGPPTPPGLPGPPMPPGRLPMPGLLPRPGTVVGARTPPVAGVDVAGVDDVASADHRGSRPPAGIGGAPGAVARPNRRADPARSPVPVVVGPDRADRHGRSEGQKGRNAGIGLVHRDRIVRWDIDHRRVRRSNRDDVLALLDAGRDGLLGSGLERARLFSLCAQRLDDVRDVLRLIHESVAEVRRPVEILAHLSDDIRKSRQRLHRRIPVRAVDSGIIILRHGLSVSIEPTVNLDDLDRIGAGGQHLRQQAVRVERDRREEFLELGPAEAVLRRRRLRRGLLPGPAQPELVALQNCPALPQSLASPPATRRARG